MEYDIVDSIGILPTLGLIAVPFVLSQFEDRLPTPETMANIGFLIILAAMLLGFYPLVVTMLVAVYYHILCQVRAAKLKQ